VSHVGAQDTEHHGATERYVMHVDSACRQPPERVFQDLAWMVPDCGQERTKGTRRAVLALYCLFLRLQTLISVGKAVLLVVG